MLEFFVSPDLDPEEVIFGPVETSQDAVTKFSGRARTGNTLWSINKETQESNEIGHWDWDPKTQGVVYVRV